jgi:hypothetical protein
MLGTVSSTLNVIIGIVGTLVGVALIIHIHINHPDRKE